MDVSIANVVKKFENCYEVYSEKGTRDRRF